MTTERTSNVWLLAVTLIQLSNLGSANSAKALYAFGDSFVTTGNGGYMGPPYGIAWPGFATGRASDGRNQVDYLGKRLILKAYAIPNSCIALYLVELEIPSRNKHVIVLTVPLVLPPNILSAELFGVPSPIPSFQLKNDSASISGVNFAQGGAGVTYAFGYTPLDTQVNDLENLVQRKALSKSHLRSSVALVSLGVNDYGAYNAYNSFKESVYALGVKTAVTTVVDGIAFNLVRLHGLGIRNIVIANLATMACSPYITVMSNYSSCSGNTTLAYETSTHNTLLHQRVKLLKQELRGANFVIVDQTKAFEHIFHNGAQYGFENPLTPCCTGKDDLYVLNCGYTDSAGKPLYKVCQYPERAVIFDGIHPTQAAWKTVINLYASVPGFTLEGPNLKEWIQRHRV